MCRKNRKIATCFLDVLLAATYAFFMKQRSKAIAPKRLTWLASRPNNDLPRLPPLGDLETKAILKQCVGARAALGELKQAAQLIPNRSMLINTVPLLEAQASSEIENIVTTNDQLFKYREEPEHADPATKEALRYSQALLDGYQAIAKRPLNTSTAEQVCSQIKGMEMRVRRIAGTALARGNGEIVYTPPEGEPLLRDLLANWERFMHEAAELDPLIRLAVGHYQFEAIHPFTDGNGRTGRILNSLFLIQEKLLSLPILYLSRYFIDHRADYYRLLLAVTRDAAWEEWILFVLRGVEETSRWTTEKIDAIRTLSAKTAENVKKKLPKIYSLELVNLLFELPYCRIANVVAAKIAERQAASRYLKQLVEIGVLEERSAGREKLFLHAKLLRLLTQDDRLPAE